MKEFYDKHKKEIWIVTACTAFYLIGYRNGFNTFKKVLINSCKIVSKELNVQTF